IINHDIGKRASPTAEMPVFLCSEASFCPDSFCLSKEKLSHLLFPKNIKKLNHLRFEVSN
ncbi:hypothetical protein, partial [Streptococcus pluranimalium]|uniref:hypothetical protein n=1 Tax=Streptococcus pluranimalium TaxID=82348 RepID=UPI0039FC2522